jgi:hypothetical protein
VIVTTFLLATSSPNHIVFVLSFVLTYSFLFLFFLGYNITMFVYFGCDVHFIHNPQPYYYQCSYYYFYHNLLNCGVTKWYIIIIVTAVPLI